MSNFEHELNLSYLFSVLLRDRSEPRVQPDLRLDLQLVRLLLGLGLALPGQVGQLGRLGRAARPRLRRAGPRPPVGAGNAVQINLVELIRMRADWHLRMDCTH